MAVSIRTKKRMSVGNIAALLVATSFFGQLLGLLRTRLVNANFPAIGPESTDAYFAAFNIPDLLFFTISAGALGVAFMPVLADRLQKGDKKSIWELSSSLLNLLAGFMAIVAVVIFVFAEPLIRYVVAPNLGGEQLDNAVLIMRILALNPLLFTISGIIMSVQQTLGRFFFFAIAPLLYNTSIIISALVFSVVGENHGGPGNLGIVGLGVGALIGGVVQLCVALIGLKGVGFRWRPKIVWKSPDFRLILRQLPPRSLDQGADQVNSIVETNLASRLGAGAITHYNNAFTLHNAPIMLIGTAIATAAFPSMNNRLSQGRPDLFRKEFLQTLRAMIWIVMPVAVICFFARGYLARLLFSRNAPEIALIFGFLTAAIFFRVVYALVSRWFYSQKDTVTPLIVSVFVIAFNIILSYNLAQPDSYGVAGLALAQSIVAAVEVAILGVIMVLRDHKLFDFDFINGLIKIVSVTGFSVIAGYIMISYLPLSRGDTGLITLGTKFALIAGVTAAVHIAVSAIFGLEETKPILRWAKRVVFRPIRVQ
jgi:putative peptidoglycan lipid II flippase